MSREIINPLGGKQRQNGVRNIDGRSEEYVLIWVECAFSIVGQYWLRKCDDDGRSTVERCSRIAETGSK
jgi:hypothetical protein